jgi:uncharacterized protein YkwD
VQTDYPPDPPSDIPWSANYGGLNDVIDAFNSARSRENTLLGTFLKPMVAPQAAAWAQMSDGERALWLINEERTVRGLAPLHGLETNTNEVAQSYTEWLLANNQFDHNADGRTPWQRLEAKPAINACHDFQGVAENLYWQGTTSSDGVPLVVEQAVYWWIYDDSSSQWGHRHAILWKSYTENSGAPDREGFFGFGHARGRFTDPFGGDTFNYSDMIVMNIFDPCATWVTTPPVEVPTPPNPDPVEPPPPPPNTRKVSGKSTTPNWETVVSQPFEDDTWPGEWEVSDADGEDGGEYLWIPADCVVYEGTYSGMAIGGGTDGTPLTCVDSYPNNASSWMTYGPFSLEDAIGAVLDAKIWVDTEIEKDQLCLMVSTDGNDFKGTCISGFSDGWFDQQLDLSAVHELGSVLDQSGLYIGIAFFSDDGNTRPNGGAFVDNLQLSKAVVNPGDELYGVTITSETGDSITTDQNGDFTLAGLSPGKHTLTPRKDGYEFYPPSMEVDLSTSDLGGISFVGMPTPALTGLPNGLHLPLISNPASR